MERNECQPYSGDQGLHSRHTDPAGVLGLVVALSATSLAALGSFSVEMVVRGCLPRRRGVAAAASGSVGVTGKGKTFRKAVEQGPSPIAQHSMP
jgi:hypothetical protein